MTMRALAVALMCALPLMLTAALPAQAAREAIAVDLAQDHVDISTGFNGAVINFYGVREKEGALAVVISGPRADAVVRRKAKIGGVWINADSMTFEDVPSYYNFALDRPENELAPDILKKQDIGFAALRFPAKGGEASGELLKLFQDALIRNKQKAGLFPLKAQDIVFLSDRFFKASFTLPPRAPIGTYKVHAFLVRNGHIEAVKTMRLKVAQVGLAAAIHDFAHGRTSSYGILCIVFSLLAGWLSNAIRRTGS